MLEDYELDYGKPYAWLSWGGLILPEVVRNKDGSLMGFVRYGNGVGEGKLRMDYPDGWAMWLDKQHLQGKDAVTLCLLWNPMKKGKSSIAWNGYGGEQVEAGKRVDHFLRVLLKLEKEAASLSPGSRVLRLGEVLTYLKTALQMVPEEVSMPDVPLYLDAVLSRDMDMKLFAPGSADKNRLNIRNREIVAISLKSSLRESRLALVLRAFHQMDYRFCRRVLLMPEEKLGAELKRLTGGWCRQRESITEYMLSKQKGSGGMASDMLIFAIRPEELEARQEYIRQVLEAVDLPFVMEDFGCKQVWWSSLPGMFRAGGRQWPRKIEDWEEWLLLGGSQTRKEAELVQA